MTSPVFTYSDSMSFIVQSNYTRETIPEPTDPNINIQELPARYLAVLRFSCWGGEETVKKKKRALLETLKENKIETRGMC